MAEASVLAVALWDNACCAGMIEFRGLNASLTPPNANSRRSGPPMPIHVRAPPPLEVLGLMVRLFDCCFVRTSATVDTDDP